MKIISDCIRLYCPSQNHLRELYISQVEKRLNAVEYPTTGVPPISIILKKKILPSGDLADIDEDAHKELFTEARNNIKAVLSKRKKFFSKLNNKFGKLQPGDQVLAKFIQLLKTTAWSFYCC